MDNMNVRLGKEWDYFDYEKAKRKITKIFDIKLDEGRVITDCLESVFGRIT
jgi:hypothetical protein